MNTQIGCVALADVRPQAVYSSNQGIDWHWNHETAMNFFHSSSTWKFSEEIRTPLLSVGYDATTLTAYVREV